MPYPVAALISWRPFYQSADEPFFTRQNHKGISHDFQNFLRSGARNGFFYGYVPFTAENMSIERLADVRGDVVHAESIEGVRVYWLARRPGDNALCLVGWYEDAEAFRFAQSGPMRLIGNPEIWYRFRARQAFLLAENQRPIVDLHKLGLPPQQLHANITYLNENNEEHGNPDGVANLRNHLEAVADVRRRHDSLADTITIEEFRRRRTHEAIERNSNYRQFRWNFGNTCQACGFTAEGEPWSRALELHHLIPINRLALDEVRNVTPREFALLCANCHRAIHATDLVDDIERFRLENVLAQ
ncbi:HNH endonuclease [Paracoccus sphaerophysae]|uniref:HNH endonuclease n=1 Tax=Paracoccus sphaerophysae TaxID=690417 RepID=UPI0023562A6D|nr:HNH endonuclease [Paracoccus sphaerophysae]